LGMLFTPTCLCHQPV